MPYEVFRGRVLSAEELAVIRLQVESFDAIEPIDDEMQALIIRHWPDLAANCRRTGDGTSPPLPAGLDRTSSYDSASEDSVRRYGDR